MEESTRRGAAIGLVVALLSVGAGLMGGQGGFALAMIIWASIVVLLWYVLDGLPWKTPARRLVQAVSLLVIAWAVWTPMRDQWNKERSPLCPFLIRPWTAKQLELFQAAIAPGNRSHIQITAYAEEKEAKELSRQLRDVFTAAGWDVGHAISRGTGHGIRILSNDSNSREVSKIQTGLHLAGGVPYYFYWKNKAPGQPGQELEMQIGEPYPIDTR